MACGIYLIRNKTNGKYYVGQARNIRKRWMYYQRSETTKSRPGIAGAGLLRKAIKKYGITNFEFSVLEELPRNDPIQMNLQEQFWVSKFHAFVEDGGYNLTVGGGQNGKFSTTSRNKMSKSHIGLSHTSGMKGRKHSVDAKLKMSENNKGKHSTPRGPMSEEHRQKIRNGWSQKSRLAAAERAKNNPTPSGWHHTDESKQKMSESKKGRPATNLGVPRTDEMKARDRIIALKRYLNRGQPCIKCSHLNSHNEVEIHYFVSTNEVAIRLTGLTGAMTTVQHILDNPNWVSPKPKNKAWQTLKDWKIEYCPQSEFLEHHPELK
jgi:group I intron endonuclease